MTAYADSSALFKLVLDEPGTQEMRDFADKEEIVAASIGYVELRAGLALAVRIGRAVPALRDQLVAVVEQVWSAIDEVAVDQPLLRDAGDLAEQFGLRSYDAVHLAALRRAGAPGALVFACWDTDLRRAAAELGYSLFPQ